MRWLLPLVSLLAAVGAVAVDRAEAPPESAVCARFGCRDDQLAAVMAAHGVTPEGLAAFVRLDATNPHVWATYGEYLAGAGDTDRAETAFHFAQTLGPNLSPVLMRAANFAFGHERTERGLELMPAILAQTDEFDDILFSYVDRAGLHAADVVGSAVPPTPRAGRAWARWVSQHGSDADVLATWSWLQREKLTDQTTAVSIVNTLWQRRAFADAESVWRAFMPADDTRGGNQLLANASFARAPLAIPFDWDLSPRPGVTLERRDGLTVRFKGDTNVGDIGVRQSVAVSPGSYRFKARVRADNVGTDEGVFFTIADAEDVSRLRLTTTPILGTMPETDIVADVVVPEGTRTLVIGLGRTPSLKFDSNLTGSLSIRSIELFPSQR